MRAAQDEVAGLGGRVEDALLAALFDLDLHARAEHLARVHDPIDGLERLAGGPAVQRVADRRAAARADDQRDLARQHVMLGVGRRAEDPVVGRGDARLPHQLLGEDLAPLQLGGFLPRAEDPQALALKDVDDPLGQRLLRADDRQADSLALGELEQAPVIARLDRHVLRVERRSGVARCAERPTSRVAIASVSSKGRAPALPCRSPGLSTRPPLIPKTTHGLRCEYLFYRRHAPADS